jgi:hypothetical protein
MKTIYSSTSFVVMALSLAFQLYGLQPQDITDEMRQAAKSFEKSAIEQHSIDLQIEAFQQSPVFVNTIRAIFENPSLVGDFELSDAQEKDIQALLNEFKMDIEEMEVGLTKARELKDVKSENDLMIKIRESKQQLATSIFGILLPAQLHGVAFCLPERRGFQNYLLQPSVSKILDLTDDQKTEIEEKSKQLAEKVTTAIEEFRNENFNSSLGVLTDEQRTKLQKLVPVEMISEYFGNASVEKVRRDANFGTNNAELNSQTWNGVALPPTKIDKLRNK